MKGGKYVFNPGYSQHTINKEVKNLIVNIPGYRFKNSISPIS